MSLTESLTESRLIEMAEGYFAAVDAKDVDAALGWLTADCVFTVETDGLVHRGRDGAIKGMFERLFARYAAVWHGNFRHVVDVGNGTIACQFDVRNTGHDGALHTKRNANFFIADGGRFARISVYMSGENALD